MLPLGEELHPAGILDHVLPEVFIGHAPNDGVVRGNLTDAVAIGVRDEGVPIVEADGSEGPVFLLTPTVIGLENFDDLAGFRLILLDRKIEQLGGDQVAVGKWAEHTHLHMGILQLAL